MSYTSDIFFRTAELSDLREMQRLFIDTVTTICSQDYTKHQIRAWTSGVEDKKRWLDRFENQHVLLALKDHQITGFASIKEGNYIDMLFVHKDFQGQGIARELYRQLEEKAHELNSDYIESDVSITAKPFFEKMGFLVLAEQKVVRNGVELVNYRMRKELK